MPRLASLYFPNLAIERMLRADGRPNRVGAPPERRESQGEREERCPIPAAPDRIGSNHGFLPPAPLARALTLEEESALRGECSCPRGGGWRPGARWAENSKERNLLAGLKARMVEESSTVHRAIGQLPPDQRPTMRELGRRTDPAPVVFRSDKAGAVSGGAPVVASAPLPGLLSPTDTPMVTAHKVGSRILLAAISPAARAIGLSAGMAVTQARALFPNLDVRDAQPDRDAALLDRIALLAARRWTPRAAVSGPDGLWLDLSGVAHLFGGEERMCAMIVRRCARIGLTARIAVAGTLGMAHAAARFLDAPVTRLREGAEAEMLAPFPLRALRVEQDVLAAASRLGIERVGELLAMPRAPLQRRFGNTLLKRLDQALGRMAEPFEPIVPVAPRATALRFAEPIASAEAIAQALGDAMTPLIAALGRSGLGLRLLDLACERVDNAIETVRIGTARATRDGGHLLRLLIPKIETIDPGFGIERLTLTATRVEPLGAEALPSALAGEQTAPDLAQLVDRLAGRLGSRRLYRMSAVESDVPERSTHRVGALGESLPWPAWPRPVRLLSPPEPLSGVLAMLPDAPPRRFTWRGRHYRLTRGDGPERVHGEWWRRRAESEAVRDYFQVEDETGGRFFLFRKGDGVDPRTGNLSWWLQGMMG